MMEDEGIKLPVFGTFFRALGFTIWNGWTIFRLSWFPFALYIAAAAAMQAQLLHDLQGQMAQPANALPGSNFDGNLALQCGLLLVQLITTASVAVSIHRIILFGDRRPGHYFPFAFGRTELLYVFMAVASAIFMAIIIATVLVPIIILISGGDPVAYIRSAFPTSAGEPNAKGIAGLASGYLLAWIVAAYFMLRLAVWPPAIVATNTFSLGDAWRMTKGNVLRLFGLFLLPVLIFWIPVVLAVAAYWYVNAPPPKPAPASAPPLEQSSPALNGVQLNAALLNVVKSAQLAMQNTQHPPESGTKHGAPKPLLEQQSLEEAMPIPLYDLWLLQFFLQIYLTAYGVALLSYSYKALMGYDAGEPIRDAT